MLSELHIWNKGGGKKEPDRGQEQSSDGKQQNQQKGKTKFTGLFLRDSSARFRVREQLHLVLCII